MVRLHRYLHFLLIPFLLLAPGCASVDLSAVGDLLSQADPLDEPTVAAGLREALDVGTQRAVGTLSAEGGLNYYKPKSVEGKLSWLLVWT